MTPAPLTARQRDILNFFREYLEENGISPTLEEIAAHFGVNKVTIFGHVAELERKGVLKRAARGVSRGLQLVDEEESSTGEARIGAFAILGTIAAGSPIETIEEPENLELGELVPRGSEVYALRVQGNSMIEDAIADGDLVLVERRNQAHNGETVVAVLPDETTTLKRFYRDPKAPKSKRIRLQPANSTMQAIYLPDVEIRGVVVAVIRRM
ncbi:MAG: transcriptional repressor LexA [Planctomycetota bacterium]